MTKKALNILAIVATGIAVVLGVIDIKSAQAASLSNVLDNGCKHFLAEAKTKIDVQVVAQVEAEEDEEEEEQEQEQEQEEE